MIVSAPAVTTAQQPRVIGRPFVAGQCANPAGRPKGSRHKLGEAFIQAMLNDFEEHGSKVVEAVRTEQPAQYLKVVASILPKELNIRTTATEEMSDDDLALGIAALQSILAAQSAGTGGPASPGHKQAALLQPVREAEIVPLAGADGQ
jgi:hypothetical protein